MPKSFSRCLILTFLILLASSCLRKPSETEGMIRFRITYEENRLGGYSAAVLPRELIMEFSHDRVRNTIEGGLGFFSLVNISDLRNYQNTTWLKFIDKKYIYTGENKEAPCCFDMLEGMELNFTDSVKEIAGFECKQAIASFPEDAPESFPIWYTEELGLYDPNGITPFKKIPGVLLEFNTLMGNANMKMVATSYVPKRIPLKQFRPPKDYRPVSKAEMNRILNALMN